MIKPTVAILAAVAALGISACGDDDEATTTSSAAATEEASVSLTSPQEGATEGDAVTAEVEQALEHRPAADRLAGDPDRLAAGAAQHVRGVRPDGVEVHEGERRLDLGEDRLEPLVGVHRSTLQSCRVVAVRPPPPERWPSG